ncbi:MAG: Hsp70 family protein [Gemmataceae bacterium]
MAYSLFDYFQKQGVKVVESSLQKVVGKPATYVKDEAHFRQLVLQPGWEALAPPIRLLLRRRYDQWVELYHEVRDKVIDLNSGVVDLRPNATALIASLLRRYFPPDAAAKTPPGASPPLAQPVGDVPLASPVAAPAGKTADKGGEEAAEVAVGIDLGTTYSLIAYVDAQGRPVCIPNANGDLLTPSVVLFDDEGSVVGKEAVQASLLEPDRVADVVKRDMGNKVYRKKINGEYMPPEVISSLILRSLKGDAERKLGPVRKAVITVPAYFEETRRRATMDAGKLAGLDVLDIINEPTAAAIAYGYQLGFLDRTGTLAGDKPLRVLVFDLGGGTFDVTIVEIKGREFKALATDGDVHLGGKDWDERLVALAADRFREHHGEDPRDNPVSLQELSIAVEMAKRTLTERKKATLFVNHVGTRFKVELTREEFEEATAALLERTRMTSELVVRQAGVTWADIDRVLLVGGSTRMPMVVRMLQDLAGKPPDASINPDEAVAHGAALYAELLAPRHARDEPSFSVTNVNSHSLGILGANPETGRRLNKILIPKNAPLPHTVTKEFKTFRANQKAVVIKVLEGESDRPEVCTQIGVCAIRDLPANLPVGWPVLVSYTYESNGRLHVSARLKGHKAGVSTDFERENQLPDEEIEMWTKYIEEELNEQDEG